MHRAQCQHQYSRKRRQRIFLDRSAAKIEGAARHHCDRQQNQGKIMVPFPVNLNRLLRKQQKQKEGSHFQNKYTDKRM